MANLDNSIVFSNPHCIPKNGLPLDTLAQLPTTPLKTGLETLQKRARSKWYTTAIIGSLLYTDTPLHQYYRNAYYCNHILTQYGQEITGKYCNTRVCHVCNRIRTAKLINGYVGQLMGLEGLEFVTLTIPNCTSVELRSTVDRMIKAASNIVRVLRERRRIDVSGIRKIEITYNEKTDTYHPHLHFLVSGKVGQLIVDEWVKRFTDAKLIAQSVVDADKGSLNELFKYTTKIITKKRGAITVYIKPLDIIMQSLVGRRIIQPFGKMKLVDEEIKELETMTYDSIPEYDFMIWEWDNSDWKNGKGEGLTGYTPPTIEIQVVE